MNPTLTDAERLIIMLALEARVEKYAGYVESFKEQEKYAEHYKAAKAALENTVGLLDKIKGA